MYILINRKSWNRFKNIQKYQLKSRHNDKRKVKDPGLGYRTSKNAKKAYKP